MIRTQYSSRSACHPEDRPPLAQCEGCEQEWHCEEVLREEATLFDGGYFCGACWAEERELIETEQTQMEIAGEAA